MKRTRIEIIVDILKISLDGVNKTKIVYGASLNFKQGKAYIDFLVDANLLQHSLIKNKSVYQTTDKGEEMLKRFQEFSEIPGLTNFTR